MALATPAATYHPPKFQKVLYVAEQGQGKQQVEAQSNRIQQEHKQGMQNKGKHQVPGEEQAKQRQQAQEGKKAQAQEGEEGA